MTYVLSDIHGNKKAFNSILEQIKLQPDDDLYILGDVIDRHPYGIELLQQIMAMPNAHMLLGNHEYMMMKNLGKTVDAEDDCSAYGTMQGWCHDDDWTTYDKFRSLSKDEQEELVRFICHLPSNFQITVNGQKFYLVHWDKTIQHMPNTPELDHATVIFGHIPTRAFQPDKNPLEIYRGERIIGIDCGAGWLSADLESIHGGSGYMDIGRLACLRLDDMEVFYSHDEIPKDIEIFPYYIF